MIENALLLRQNFGEKYFPKCCEIWALGIECGHAQISCPIKDFDKLQDSTSFREPF